MPMRPRHVKKKGLPQKTFTLNLHIAKKQKARTHTTSFTTSLTLNLHNLLARSPVHAICSASSLASCRTSTTATQIVGAEQFRRRRVHRSLETNWSRREPQSKGLFFMIFPFPQFGFRIGCSDFLFALLESFKF